MARKWKSTAHIACVLLQHIRALDRIEPHIQIKYLRFGIESIHRINYYHSLSLFLF